MGFLNILGYIGIGLLAALLLSIIDISVSGKKITLIDEDGNYAGNTSEINIYRAYITAVIELLAVGTVMLCVLARMSVFKALGIAALGAIVYLIAVGIFDHIIAKAIKAKSDEDKEAIMYFFFAVTCLLNGAGFAVLVHFWGWF